MKRIGIIILKVLASIILVALFITVLSETSPVYKFDSPHTFEGPDIFNPYSSFDSTTVWKRANFHTHTKVKGLFNECKYWPEDVYQALEKFGYDIVTFSNHNELTSHPFDPKLQVNVYEHGINLFKYHKLVFGSKKVLRFDNILPFFTSQRQFQMDLLGQDSDFIQLNHPMRTNFTSRRTMERLSGYQITELDSGVTTTQEYWDWALSCGHYSFALANDDLHYPDRHDRIAIRCNFLNCTSGEYIDLKNCLLGGCYYSMRIPDYGNGDWKVKYERNRHLPSISSIGLNTDGIFISLSSSADSIKFTGSGHRTLLLALNTDKASYKLPSTEPYARITAYFNDGAVIYTNPFARFDRSLEKSPFRTFENRINWLLTVLYNIAILAISALIALSLRKLWKKRKNN